MIRAFVEAEVESPVYGAAYARAAQAFGADREALFHPDADRLRAKVLRAVRGYPVSALFTGFPSDPSWNLAAISVRELGGFLYLREYGWVALSGGTRLVRDGAANVQAARRRREGSRNRRRGGGRAGREEIPADHRGSRERVCRAHPRRRSHARDRLCSSARCRRRDRGDHRLLDQPQWLALLLIQMNGHPRGPVFRNDP